MRTKSAARIVGSNIILQLILVISGLILPRFIISAYGSEINGLISSVKQFLLYFSVVGTGIGVASMSALYSPLAEGDVEKINAIASATRIRFNKAGYIFLGALIVLIVLYPLFIHSTIPTNVIVLLVSILSGGAILEFFLLSKYRTYLNAAKKAYIILIVQALGVLTYTVAAIILIKMQTSILIVQLAATACYGLRTLLVIRYTKKLYPRLSFKEEPNFSAIPQQKEAFLYKITGMVIQYTPIIVITVFLGLKQVSVYSVYNMIFISLAMLGTMFSTGIAALFGNVVARKDQATLYKSFRAYELMYSIILFFCYTCAYKLIIPFVRIYTQGVTDVEYVVPIIGYLFVFSGLCRSIRMPYQTLVDATGSFKRNCLLNIGEAVAVIVFCTVLCIFFGISGVLLATIVAGGLRSICYLVCINRNILKSSPLKSILRLLVNFVVMVLLILIPFDSAAGSILEWIILAIKVSATVFVVVTAANVAVDLSSAKYLIVKVKQLLRYRRIGGKS